MSGGDDNDVQRIKVSFESCFNNAELVPFEAYVEYGGTRNVIRCTSARNGSLLVYGHYIVAACTEKDCYSSKPIIIEIIREEVQLNHNRADLNMIGKEVFKYFLSLFMRVKFCIFCLLTACLTGKA
jgi:hypothetical protein